MTDVSTLNVDGFRPQPRKAPDGNPYTGRATLYDVQFSINPTEIIATCTITARQLVDMSRGQLIWVDHNVQRGVKPGTTAPANLPLADGYPDAARYIFDRERADDMAEKLLHGRRVFLNPLIWNLRPGTFDAYYDANLRQIYVYTGRFYIPDSHHRHQAIQKAVTIAEEAPTEFPLFSDERRFTVELYFMSVADEGEYFFEKNQLGKQADRSRAFELTTEDRLSQVAKRAIEMSPSLTGNVNRVTDRLTSRNPQVVTLSTLRSMVATFLGDEHIAEEDVIDAAQQFADTYEMLAAVRPELGHLDESERAQVRRRLLVDQAVLMHGYARVMKHIRNRLRDGDSQQEWQQRLEALAAPNDQHYQGDIFSRENPRWRELGVLQVTRSGRLTVSNTRQTRDSVADFLLQRVGINN